MNARWPEVERRLRAHPDDPALFHRAFGSPGVDSMRTAFALAQFERTLLSFGSRYDRFRHLGDSTALSPLERHGLEVFLFKGHCADCHMPPRFTDGRTVNIGLEAEPVDKGLGERTGIPWHMGRFKTPTLRNVAVTAPYMHDGRFATLEEVVRFYASGVNTGSVTLDAHMLPWLRGEVLLSAEDRTALVAFLHALTDSTFLTDPRLGPPR
jgi:cytochrome c peroxidase